MNILIDKNEVLRYLGYKTGNADDDILHKIDECILKISSLATPKYIYKYFDFSEKSANSVLCGDDIKKHLENCTGFALMAVTLGSGVDAEIRTLEIKHLADAVIFDSCATAAVESVCDSVCNILAAENSGMFLTSRFSPGYGDMPLDVQPQFLHLLDAPRKIGLNTTDTNILIPRKSVTAVVGIAPFAQKTKKNCGSCSMRNTCSYRKNGDFCEN